MVHVHDSRWPSESFRLGPVEPERTEELEKRMLCPYDRDRNLELLAAEPARVAERLGSRVGQVVW
ncbi:MAG: hypothetical protein KDA84_05350, partial [Planctomycetaceae bacterium]|nr:hypothetical protein [Planctomycetaceae bacterium]